MVAKRQQPRKNSAPEIVLDTVASLESLQERKTALMDESLSLTEKLKDAEEIIRLRVSAEVMIAAIKNGEGRVGDRGAFFAVADAIKLDSECQQLKKRHYEIDTLLLKNEIEQECVKLRERMQVLAAWEEAV